MWDVRMTQEGSGVAGVSSSSRGFHQSLRDGTFRTVPKSSSPEVCSLSAGARSSFIYLEDEGGGGGGSCEDPKALEALGAPEAPGEGGGGGRDPKGVLGESNFFRRFLQASAKSA
ncbi:hypothetical protein Tco_1071542 [Tanacetum coccineum]